MSNAPTRSESSWANLDPARQKRTAIERAKGPMPVWSRAGRDEDWAKLSQQEWDVIVIGGGITGCGVALDAAARGLKVALLEKHDFASGTSSRSSKLVHGGLRYLRQGQFAVTWESSREKRCLKKLAPHLVDDLAFLLASPKGRLNRWQLNLGLWIYDWAAGFPKGLRHHRQNRQQAAARMPGLCEQRYDGGFVYYDGRADDCRLTLHVAKSAVKQGATLINYAEVRRLLPSESNADGCGGVVVQDVLPSRGDPQFMEGNASAGADALPQQLKVRAKVVVSATGVWCEQLLPSETDLVRPSMGVHLVFSAKDLPCQDAVVMPTPGTEGAVFVIRDGDDVIAGTSDEFFDGPLDQPSALASHVDLILRRLNAALPGANLSRKQVRSSYAGLRPLLKGEGADSTKLSRDEVVLGEAPGLLTVTGGKLTTYRKMAADVVDRIADGLALPNKRSFTDQLPMFSAPHSPEEAWVRAYGSEASAVEASTRKEDGADFLVPGRHHTVGEADYLFQYERAMTLADVLCRRTRLALYEWEQSQELALKIAVALRPLTVWNPQREVQRFWQESKQFQEEAGEQ